MKCNHVDKDAPENAQCEDCGTDNNLRKDEKLVRDFKRKFQLEMKGGQNGKNNKH